MEPITDEMRQAVRVALYTRFRNVREFCRKHPEFDGYFMSTVMNADSYRALKFVKRKVKRLFNLLKIDYDSDNSH